MFKFLLFLTVLGLAIYGGVSAYEDINYSTELTITEEIKEQCFPKGIRNQNFQEIEFRQCLKESIANG